MRAALQTKAKTPSSTPPAFTSVRSGVRQCKCACGGTSGPTGECETCHKKRLQRRSKNAGVETQNDFEIPPIVHEVLRSSGQPLDIATRAFMERRFAHDFSRVRVHTDGQAAASAQAVEARAYTVGSDIVFGAKQYRPNTQHGRWLLGHELAHVMQQGRMNAATSPNQFHLGAAQGRFEQEAEAHSNALLANQPVRGVIARLEAPALQRVSIFQRFQRLVGFEGSFETPELQAYLAFLDRNNRIEDNFDSDNKAREIVRRSIAGTAGYTLSVRRKILLIREMMSGFTGDADEAAIMDLLSASPDSELTTILGDIGPETLRDEIHGEEGRQYDQLIAGWRARTAPLGTRDAFAGTHAVTPTEHAVVETALTPGATLGPAPPAPVGAPPPPPVVVPPTRMTGIGVGGAFETAMIAALRTAVGAWGARFRSLQAAGPPAFPISRANSIAISAQQQSESYFAPYIRVASHAPADEYHPGAYSLPSMIGDQSTVPISDNGVVVRGIQRPGRIGWTSYWMTQDSSGGAAVMNSHHCVPTRNPDRREFARVRNRFATNRANQTDIDDAIHGWPAEATGGVNIQPYQSAGSRDAERQNRWDLFTTLLHEMMHVLEHPNYERTRILIGGTAQEILKEGMADVMRHDLWDGPGALASRLATPTLAPLRRQVEGGDFRYDASLVQYHADYPVMSQANEIVHGRGANPGVGIANAKAAFFMGHTELLGLGAGTATSGGASLARTANYSATESADAEIFVVSAGDTYASIRGRTNAPAGGILDARNAPVAPGAAFAPGTRLRIPGLRYVYALREDTLGSMARQHGVSPAGLARANNLPPATPSAFRFAAGRRVLIPIH